MWLHKVSVRFPKLSYSLDSNKMPESPSLIVFMSRFHNILPQVTHYGLAPLPEPSLALPALSPSGCRTSNTLRAQGSRCGRATWPEENHSFATYDALWHFTSCFCGPRSS